MTKSLKSFLRLVSWLCVAAVATTTISAHDLTFQERVRAQEAIERVYYAHQVGATRRFEEAIPRADLEARVRGYLRESAALESLWKIPVTAEMLQRETERIARTTKMPGRLRELFRALDDDPLLVQECLVRPVLVDRLARQRFETDATIHGGARREIEEIRRHLGSRRTGAIPSDPSHTVVEIVREESTPAHAGPAERDSRVVRAGSDRRVALNPEEFAAYRALLPSTIGEVGAVVESREQYSFQILLEEESDRLAVAVYIVPRVSWDAWWADRTPDHQVQVRTVADPPGPLPAISPDADCPADDTWSPFRPEGRDKHSAVWTGNEMIVWGGHLFDPARGDVLLGSGARYDPVTDTWGPISAEGAPEPLTSVAVWTGSEALFWGGASNAGSLYDPVTDRWRPITTQGAPVQPGCQGVWTGQDLLTWCSVQGGLNQGARYDPATDEWQPISTSDSPSPRSGFTTIWTGTEMIVWGGGVLASGWTNTGGRYDPAADTWIATSIANAPGPRHSHSAVWSGRVMIIWGGNFATNTGGRYDPATDSWQAIFPQGTFRTQHTAVWTGSKMFVHGGLGSSGQLLDEGRLYDPDTDNWAWVSDTKTPGPRLGHSLIWTGDQAVVWGGRNASQYLGSVGRYVPSWNAWLPPTPHGPPFRLGGGLVWTGSLMIAWGGGFPYTGGSSNTGDRYDPALDAWTPTSVTGAPPPMAGGIRVWTGTEMIVRSGSVGGLYDPAADRWRAMATAGAPPARGGSSTVWTGSELIVWGGVDLMPPELPDVYYNEGARFDPVANSWRPTTTVNAPVGRAYHSAVWSGTSMIVWGGYYTNDPDPRYVWLDTGGRYDPATDTWTPTSTANAPSARAWHHGAWAGDVMVIFSGSTGFAPRLGTGGRYDPSTDSWSATSTVGIPNRTAETWPPLWTGSLLLFWGQGNGPTDAALGARYEPVADTWSPMSTVNGPVDDGGNVWTGDAMFVWGGSTNLSRYFLSPDADRDGFSACGGDCDDGNAGIHPGAGETCNALDDDCDGTVDEGFDADGDGRSACMGDCDDADSLIWSAPLPVTGVRVNPATPTGVSWDDQGPFVGAAILYDMVSGPLPGPTGPPGFAEAVCLYSGAVAACSDTRPNPPPGSAWWYLTRGRNSCGTGTYGGALQDQQIPACF